MKALHQILAQQRQLMAVSLFVRTPEQMANDSAINHSTHRQVMRYSGFAYNLEHPHFQLTQRLHAGGVGEETLKQAGLAVMLHSLQVASAQASATYPMTAR